MAKAILISLVIIAWIHHPIQGQAAPDTVKMSAFKLEYNKFKWEHLIILTQNPDTLRLRFLSKALLEYRPRVVSGNDDVTIRVVEPNTDVAHYWLLVFEFQNDSGYQPVPFDVYVDFDRPYVVPIAQNTLNEGSKKWKMVSGSYLVGSHNIPFKPFLNDD